ncbi:MAG: SRPBCC family protein [Bryobacteraceae bacterium]
MRIQQLLWVVALSAAVWPARADVLDSAAGGFSLKIAVTIHASPHDVYAHLLRVADWWDSAHTFSGNAHNLRLEAIPTGCFCEDFRNGGGVRHMDVVYVEPDKTLVLRGGLGPLQRIAASGSMTLALAATPDGTRLELTFAASGYLPAGMNTLAAPVDGVLTEQVNRLKNLVEQGSPGPAKK